MERHVTHLGKRNQNAWDEGHALRQKAKQRGAGKARQRVSL